MTFFGFAGRAVKRSPRRRGPPMMPASTDKDAACKLQSAEARALRSPHTRP